MNIDVGQKNIKIALFKDHIQTYDFQNCEKSAKNSTNLHFYALIILFISQKYK